MMRSLNTGFQPFPASVAPPRQEPSRFHIADHQLLRKISAGSYGEVWLAQNTFGTLRAVKIVHRDTFWDSRPFEREFKGIQKFEPLSRAHEGLVDILQVGRTDDYFYYVMELADPVGADVRRLISTSEMPNLKSEIPYVPRTLQYDLRTRGPLPIPECIEIVETPGVRRGCARTKTDLIKSDGGVFFRLQG